MMKAAFTALVACASLGLVDLCAAQPAGITPEMIATELPEEGAPLAETGPYAVTQEAAAGTSRLTTFRPTSLDHFPKKDKLPVMVWGNGGCAIDNPRYAGFLTTIASHGFLVITTTGPVPEGSAHRQQTADDLKAAIDWAVRENSRSASPLAGKLDLKGVAVMGQSCGGALAITLGADPRVSTIGVFNSGVMEAPADGARSTFPTVDALVKLHGPVLLINGHQRDFMMERSKATFDAISTVPVFYGARHGAGHTATVYHPGGGEFANVAWRWLAWQLKGDRKARETFSGRHCGLCVDHAWDAESKFIDR
jgi:dienelactone hydrolase